MATERRACGLIKMLSKVLVANRGEIALRVIDACHQLDISTVAVYSQADREALHVHAADEAYCIGPPPATQSYLNIAQLMSAAEVSGADAVHPGYGFLAENPHFVEVCEASGLTFIGPSAAVMAQTGDKLAARRVAQQVGVPVIPGSELIHSQAELAAAAEAVGFPLMLKALAGGGGRGMRVANGPDQLLSQFHAAQREAQAAFGREDLYLERRLERPRHVEVQVLADAHGDIVHWGDRDCSVQRRYQKLVEEAPAPDLPAELQAALRQAAVQVARALGYVNAGTVEFLVEGDRFYFIELNARVQVEHPVSEMVVGRDLVVEQLRLAAGQPLGYTQRQLKLRGHALECRINAEDPRRDFLPSSGTLTIISPPTGAGVRWDSAAYTGMAVSPHYDSLLGKLITWGQDREQARRRMLTALGRLRLEGVATTRGLCREIVNHPDFAGHNHATDFIESLLG